MENVKEKKKGYVVLIVVLLIVIAILVGITIRNTYVINKMQKEDAKDKVQDEKKKDKEDTKESDKKVDSSPKTYSSYEIGNLVTLKDGSTWYSMEASPSSNITIKLLSANDVNTSHATIRDSAVFLNQVYKESLKKSLQISDVDVKLLSLEDIARLCGVSEQALPSGTSLQKYNLTWLNSIGTLLSDKISDETSYLLCKDPSRICSSGGMESAFASVAIHPVLIISKDHIQ